MRSREEIISDSKQGKWHYDKCVLEVLIDIRDELKIQNEN